jgi:Uma2 family endonuclease
MVANLKEPYRPYYTLEEYFLLEKGSERRFEYWDGQIFCMSGGSEQHATLTSNIHREVANKLRGKNCRAYTEGTPIVTPTLPPYRYPDTSAACGKPQFQSFDGIDALVNPTLVVEVLSTSTEAVDRKQKKGAYQALPSLQEYLLVAQTAHHVTRFSRHGEFWHREEFSGLDAVIPLPSLDCELALRDIYEGVVFE